MTTTIVSQMNNFVALFILMHTDIFLALCILVPLTTVVAIAVGVLLYVDIQELRERLGRSAKDNARLVEDKARFDEEYAHLMEEGEQHLEEIDRLNQVIRRNNIRCLRKRGLFVTDQNQEVSQARSGRPPMVLMLTGDSAIRLIVTWKEQQRGVAAEM
ncbi:hypothetical protein PROFUN_04428 [Planoprotostelium fungivorum]|uniref:Uncharacterized protein n=1 Tax=Planoprotostelium fungivorum TaxID=1890364 RepID=A0A2P6NVM5_9EUKA|nr:hypothetical protein PROFUN_04428 [Planoprotostelium fungivorum]